MDFGRAKAFLEERFSFERTGFKGMNEDIDLGKLRFIMSALRLNLDGVKIVHVAGSKGKGTVCTLTYDYLKLLGKKVGVFTSPHMLDVRERIVVDELIPEADFVDCLEKVKRVSEKIGVEVTYFEYLFLMAMVFFVKEEVEFIVLEVGLGGRLDATNVIYPDVAVVMRVEKEHTEVLGESYREILTEKLAICKSGVPVVVAEQNKEVGGLIREMLFGNEVYFEGDNFEVVKRIISLVEGKVDLEVFQKMVDGFKMLGRYDVRDIEGKVVVLDMAHTEASMKRLVDRLLDDFEGGSFKVLFACLADKKVDVLLSELKRLGAVEVVFTNCHDERGVLAFDLQKVFAGGKVESDVEKAFDGLVDGIQKDQVLVVTGSHFLVGKVLKFL